MKTTFLGHELQSPIIVGSSPASFGADAMIRCHEAGAGAVVCKTINRNAADNPDLQAFEEYPDLLAAIESVL